MALAALNEPVIEVPQPHKDQYAITANDNERTYTFPLGSRFSVLLDEAHYPKSELACAPAGIIEPSSDIPVATKPLWVVRFNTIGQGSCKLSDKDFTLTIVVDAGK
jgi:hypothetical protein